jgi:hypothetical protein
VEILNVEGRNFSSADYVKYLGPHLGHEFEILDSCQDTEILCNFSHYESANNLDKIIKITTY